MTEQPPFSFCRARAGRSLAIAAVIDGMETYYPFCRFCFYDHDDPPGTRWGDRRLDFRVHGVTLFQRPGFDDGRRFCLVSAEGDVAFIEDPIVVERIPGAGIESPDSNFHGRMENIRTIGERLYACGGGGQFYRRETSGTWRHLDPSFLQQPGVPVQDYMICNAIDGPNEDEVYICGYRGLLLFWDGKSARRLACPTDANLGDILVEDARTIWVCGSKGTLLRGNHRDGFARVPGVRGRSLFQSMTMFDDKLYLAASAGDPWGLFVYDYGFLRRVETGLTPEIDDPHVVDAQHDVLWAVSLKDIVRFDGTRWERIDFPGNDPIR